MNFMFPELGSPSAHSLAANNDIHIGNLSYTEDSILIYTVYVSNIAPRVTPKDFRKHFEKYGEISSLNIIKRNPSRNDTNSKPFRFAFLTFKEAESASKALQQRTHYLHKRLLTVRSADSWKQPFQDQRLVKQQSENETNELINDNSSILDLNDDVLFLIFKYLSFQDQIHLANTCCRFEYIFELLYKTKKCLEIDLSQQLTLMDFRIALQKMGVHIERIKFVTGFTLKNFQRFIVVVSQFCLNLSHLELNSLHFRHADIFRKISHNLKTIKFLELRDCAIKDEMINLLSEVKTIENLDLTGNYEVTGCYLDKFLNLKRLILNSCANIQPVHFTRMCAKVKQIKELNIRQCDRLNGLAFEAIVENLEVLETLTICTCYQTNNLEKISEIKSMKHLTVNCSNNKSTNVLWKKLVENKSDELETLIVINFVQFNEHGQDISQLKKLKRFDLPFANSLYGDFLTRLAKLEELKYLAIPGCKNITKNDLLQFIKKSPCIEEIDVSQLQLCDDFILESIDLLKQQSRKELKLFVGSTEISKDIIQDPKYIANKKLLKIDHNTIKYERDISNDYELLNSDEDEEDDDAFDIDDDNWLPYMSDSDIFDSDSDEDNFGNDMEHLQAFFYILSNRFNMSDGEENSDDDIMVL